MQISEGSSFGAKDSSGRKKGLEEKKHISRLRGDDGKIPKEGRVPFQEPLILSSSSGTYMTLFIVNHKVMAMEQKPRTPNDNQRSDAHNPNSPEYKANMDHHANQYNPNSPSHNANANNRSNQMNPNNPAYSSNNNKSRSRK